MKPTEKRIEKGLWWDRNWPVLEGCTPCSPACDNCFAAEYAHRFGGSLPYLRGLTTPEGKWNCTVIMRLDQLELPLKTKKPTVWFVAERSDLFHPAVLDEYLDRIFAIMTMSPQHTFMVLTKRPERMAKYFSEWLNGIKSVQTSRPNIMGDLRLPILNLWIGVTAENQEQAEKRIPLLLQTPAAHRFVSIEPILGTVNLTYLRLDGSNGFCECDALDTDGAGFYPSSKVLGPIDWVICGGESGHNARPVHHEWVRYLKNQCVHAEVPFFFKQWGEWAPREVALKIYGSDYDPENKVAMARVGKKAAGRLLDGKEYLEFPE